MGLFLLIQAWSLTIGSGQRQRQSPIEEGRDETMDCCPVIVSDLPVMCSGIYGMVTFIKPEQVNSVCSELYWGKFLPILNSLPALMSDVTARGKSDKEFVTNK